MQMATLRDIRRLLAFDDWANAQVMAALAPIEADVPAAVAWMAHVMAAKRIWYGRVALAAPPFTAFPDLSLPAILGQLQEARDEWARCLDDLGDGDVDRVIAYTNLKGQLCESTLGDIVTHLAIHGQHHRGQCLNVIRAAGATPPTIDFIHAARLGVV